MTHTGWIANLSDGETYFEGVPQPGDLSAWQQFLSMVKDNDLKFTGLRLQRGGVNLHALPHKKCLGYYQASELHKTFMKQNVLQTQGIGSVVEMDGANIIICWVDDRGNVWQDIRPLEGEIVHTSMR